jgi:non-heme chloroperoxidase
MAAAQVVKRLRSSLIVHGDDDQIVPIAASAQLSAKLLKNATLKVYQGAPHGLAEPTKRG